MWGLGHLRQELISGVLCEDYDYDSRVYLGNNNFSRKFPSLVQNCTALEVLDFVFTLKGEHRSISLSTKEKNSAIVQFIEFFVKKMTSIDLSSNYLTGEI